MQQAAPKENDLVLQRNQRFVCPAAYPCPVLFVGVVQTKLSAFERFRESLSNHQFEGGRNFRTTQAMKVPGLLEDLTGTRYLPEVQRHYGLATASRLRCRYRFTNAKLAHSR